MEKIALWLRSFSEETWKRIEFFRNMERNNLFETTLTQNLVYNFFQLEEDGFPIQILESKMERVNGSDIEIIIHTSNGFLYLPCQAKIVNKQLQYNTFDHSVRGTKQIDLLLNHARKFNGIPIYLFYNYSYNEEINERIELNWNVPVQFFGCSFAHAGFLKSYYYVNGGLLKIPSFCDFHHTANVRPLECLPFLFDAINLQEFINTARQYFNFVDSYITPSNYFHMEMPSEIDWKRIRKPGAIGRINVSNKPEHLANDTIENEDGFFPSYRIVFL